MDSGPPIRYYGSGMKRNNLLVIVVVIAGIFLLFDPLKYIKGNSNAVQRPATSAKAVTSLAEFAQSSWKSPEDYVVSAFAAHDIVFIGEFFKIKQNVQLVGRLIPKLYAAGIRNLGIEYALSDDQRNIDALVTAPTWDETRARAITFEWLVTWGYQEYIDLYKAAWQVNQSRPAGAQPFRIVGLNVRQNWEYLKTQNDMKNAETIAKVYGNGLPDVHMAQVIDAEFIRKGGKALVFCGTQHALTRYRSKAYEKNAREMKLAETRRAGNIVYDQIGAKAFSISLHAPWPDASQKSGLGYPADGAIDALIDTLPAEKRNAGWDTAGTPLGALSIKNSTYADGAAASTLADLWDGYIIQGPIKEYATVTPIADFIQPEDVERANKNFPGVKPAKAMELKELNQAIAEDVAQLAKTIAQFR
jgi:hypothetical protein